LQRAGEAPVCYDSRTAVFRDARLRYNFSASQTVLNLSRDISPFGA
jgi:hypothetical protein